MSKAFDDWSAHHEVPADLALAVDFANTVDHRDFGGFAPREFLATFEDLAGWLRHRGLAADPGSARDFASALHLRSAIRRIAEAHGGEAPADADGAHALSAAFEIPLTARVDATGKIGLTGADDGVRGSLGAIVAEVVLAEAEGAWRRVKMCSATDCRVVYFDHSKARNGKWCATSGCGNRIKTRTYRQRRRAGSA